MAKRKPIELTPDEERFVDEYLIDRNGSAAYVRANPGTKRTTAAEMASRLLKKRNVKRAVELGRAAIAGRTRVTADRVVWQLARVAFADVGAAFDLTRRVPVLLAPRDIPFDTRQAITGIKLKRRVISHDGEEDYEVEEWEYKFADKVAALDKLSKHLGLYKELPPLEQILALLPEAVREVVRAALAQALLAGAGAGGGGADGARGDGELSAGRERPDPYVSSGRADSGPVAGAVPPRPIPAADPALLPPQREDDGSGEPNPDALFGPP